MPAFAPKPTNLLHQRHQRLFGVLVPRFQRALRLDGRTLQLFLQRLRLCGQLGLLLNRLGVLVADLTQSRLKAFTHRTAWYNQRSQITTLDHKHPTQTRPAEKQTKQKRMNKTTKSMADSHLSTFRHDATNYSATLRRQCTCNADTI